MLKIKKEDINNWSKDAYTIAVEHGWHEREYSHHHWYAMIVSEMFEAMEAERKGLRAEMGLFHINEIIGNTELFEKRIKDTFEDELADVCIRCFDFMGLNDIKLNDVDSWPQFKTTDVLTEYIYHMMDIVTMKDNDLHPRDKCFFILAIIVNICDQKNIDINQFIKMKMAYNKNRQYKHGGKKY